MGERWAVPGLAATWPLLYQECEHVAVVRSSIHTISEEPQRGGRLRERVSAVREQLPGTRLNLGCRLNLHKFSLHGLQPGVLMSGHLGV